MVAHKQSILYSFCSLDDCCSCKILETFFLIKENEKIMELFIYNLVLDLMKFSHNFRFEKLPKPLKNLFQSNMQIHGYNTRQKSDLRTAKHFYALYNKSFLCECSKRWNNLPQGIKITKSSNFTKNILLHKIDSY